MFKKLKQIIIAKKEINDYRKALKSNKIVDNFGVLYQQEYEEAAKKILLL